ncbi:MAG: Cache 3/Cache 2 fusion domain-containing protein, partial [Pseudomonadota bacterium]|nr:Cache 3/Cache 2 fusion domain-containing protein [Pseudomonadota bacterium]
MTRLLSLLPPAWQIGHYARQLRQSLPQRFVLDAAHPMPVGDLLVPRLFNGDQLLNLNFAVPDRFSAGSGVGATIFVKHGDDFVRVTTSVKKENGERAVGTLLDRSHAGYRALLAGQPYVGHAQLFGQQYMTQYDPIRDAGGQLIAVLYVGINITRRRQFGVAARVTLIATGLMAGLSALLLWAMGAALRSVNQSVAVGDAALALRIADLQWHYAGVALVAVAAAAGLLYWSLNVFVGTPLQQAMRAAQQLAGGDLTTQVHVGRLDEIGRLMQAINGVGQGLAAVVGSVRSSTVRINASADQIANGSDQVLNGASAQADALRQSAHSMDNFTATVARNADYARSASQSVGAAAAQAVAGGVVVDRVVETMASIRASAHRIVDIISVIDGIAFQTNILALN